MLSINLLLNCPFPYNRCAKRFIVPQGLFAWSQHARNQHLHLAATYKDWLYDVMTVAQLNGSPVYWVSACQKSVQNIRLGVVAKITSKSGQNRHWPSMNVRCRTCAC